MEYRVEAPIYMQVIRDIKKRIVRALSVPNTITSGVRSNAATKTGAAIKIIMPMTSARIMAQAIPNLAPFFVRS